jgi:hypothetical protein
MANNSCVSLLLLSLLLVVLVVEGGPVSTPACIAACLAGPCAPVAAVCKSYSA